MQLCRCGKWNLMQKNGLKKGKSARKHSWTYKLRKNIISIAYSYIHYCSPLASIMQNYPSMLHIHYCSIQHFSYHLSISLMVFLSTSRIITYNSQQVLLYSLCMSKPLQHTLLCSTSKSSCNINCSSHLLISHSVFMR